MSTSERRVWIRALVVALVLALVSVGCGSSEDTGAGDDTATDSGETADTSSDESEAAEEEPADAGDEATAGEAGAIKVFLIPSPSAEAIKSFADEFTADTGIAVTFEEVPYGEAHQKQLLAYEQGNGAYDVAQFDNTFLAAFGAAGVMTPLDDYLAASAEYDIDDFSVGQQDYGKYEGQTLGLTLSTEPMIQWYRTDIYEELGLEPATTWEEYYSNAQAVEDAGLGDGQIVGFGPNVSWWWMTLVWSFGGEVYDDSLQPQVNSPEAIAATEYLKSLLDVSPEGAVSASGDDVTNKFISQDIGAMIQYSGYYGVTLDPESNKYPGLLGTAPMPQGSADITHLAGWNIGIPADSANKDQAWQFLEFVLGKSNAKAYLESGAAAIGRKSITGDAELTAEQPYLLQLNIPESSRIERYPQLKVWPEMDVAIVQHVSDIMTGASSVEDGLNDLQSTLEPILAAENG
ncbi:MAG: sugar ABC transporter substrate-binding protein [Acidimicrobiia bacterium]|nr:sugar ABC transporter substrate-binding protein [Acidimicrobiia bacterium]